MEIINWNAIPAWFVAINLIYTGFMWLVTRRTAIRMDSRIWGYTFVCLGLLYLSSYLNVEREVNLEERIVGSRLSLVLLSMSQWFPLTVSYFRHLHTRKVIDGFTRNNNHSNSDS